MNLLRPILIILMWGAVLLVSACSNNPESVATKEFMADLKKSNSYAMFGQVAKQGRYSLLDASPHLTVAQALMRAGGMAPHADMEHFVLRRGSGRFEQRLIISIGAIMRLGDVYETNPIVKAGDIIFAYSTMEFSKL
jgi:protein involved in polysaccharide export with SLBB domain